MVTSEMFSINPLFVTIKYLVELYCVSGSPSCIVYLLRIADCNRLEHGKSSSTLMTADISKVHPGLHYPAS